MFISKAAVLGAGTMGGQIAQTIAASGIDVVLKDVKQELVDAGLVISGTFEEGRLVEIVELPDHPWFVASQFHPEFKSTPWGGHPLFKSYIEAALAHQAARKPKVAA